MPVGPHILPAKAGTTVWLLTIQMTLFPMSFRTMYKVKTATSLISFANSEIGRFSGSSGEAL